MTVTVRRFRTFCIACRSSLLVAVVVLGIVALESDFVALLLRRPPETDVPPWLHVNDADLARETLATQILVSVIVLVLSTLTLSAVLKHDIPRAATTFAMLLWLTATWVFVVPAIVLGSRGLFVPGSESGGYTDFDYHAYLPHLLSAMTIPVLAASLSGLLLVSAKHAAGRLFAYARRSVLVTGATREAAG